MEIHLTGKKSIYEEIKETVERYISLGVLKDGERLPSVRNLALKLGVNPNTVARAYYELEDEGVIRSIPKKGGVRLRGGKAFSRQRRSALPSHRVPRGGALQRGRALSHRGSLSRLVRIRSKL